MRPQPKRKPERKLTRFFVINPITDRRLENRFDSREEVTIRNQKTGKTFPGAALDIGRHGLKLETHDLIESDAEIQIEFPKMSDHIHCYGQVVWARKLESTNDYESGIMVSSWHGVVQGGNSWKRVKGFRKHKDRRIKRR